MFAHGRGDGDTFGGHQGHWVDGDWQRGAGHGGQAGGRGACPGGMGYRESCHLAEQQQNSLSPLAVSKGKLLLRLLAEHSARRPMRFSAWLPISASAHLSKNHFIR